MRALALVSDAFGGRGGIALYNRNVLTALCEHSAQPEVTAVPRLVPNPLEHTLPPNLDFRVSARDSKVRFCFETVRSITRRRYDLIVVSHINLLPLGEVARRCSRAPLVLLVYGLDVWTAKSRLVARLLENVDACISIRQHTIDRVRNWAKVEHVPFYLLANAIRLEDYGPGRKPADLVRRHALTGRRILMTLARLDDPDFGVDEVIRVMPDLATKFPDLTYVVAGTGRELPRLRQLAQQLGVANEILFLGEIEEARKPDYLRLADAFAMPGSHPTDFDRYPIRFSFLEAMATGLPVVASRPDAGTDLANTPVPNIYVDPNDPKELVEGIERALEIGAGSVPNELQRYAYPAFAERFHHIIDEVLTRTRSRDSAS